MLANPLVGVPYFAGQPSNFDYGRARENKRTLVARDPTLDRIVGSVELKETSLGYFVDPAFWGGGYGKELVRACCDFFLAACGIDEIHAMVLRENIPSRRIVEGAGFIFQGLDKVRINQSMVEMPMLKYSRRAHHH